MQNIRAVLLQFIPLRWICAGAGGKSKMHEPVTICRLAWQKQKSVDRWCVKPIKIYFTTQTKQDDECHMPQSYVNNYCKWTTVKCKWRGLNLFLLQFSLLCHAVTDSKKLMHNLQKNLFSQPSRSHNVTSFPRHPSQMLLHVESLRQVALSTPHSFCHGSTLRTVPIRFGPGWWAHLLRTGHQEVFHTAVVTQTTATQRFLPTLCCSSSRRLFAMIINLSAQRHFETFFSSATITLTNEHTLYSSRTFCIAVPDTMFPLIGGSSIKRQNQCSFQTHQNVNAKGNLRFVTATTSYGGTVVYYLTLFHEIEVYLRFSLNAFTMLWFFIIIPI